MKLLPDLYLVLYAYARGMIPFAKLRRYEFTSNMLAVILSMLLLTIIVVILAPLMIVKLCAFIVLKLMYGEMFGGFLTGHDALFEENNKNVVVNMILIYSGSMDSPDAQMLMLRKFVNQIHSSSYKFACEIKTLFGFAYLIKNKVKPEEILEIVDDTDNRCLRSKLYDYIEQNCSIMNSDRMWRAIGFVQPIKWSEGNGNKKQYVAVLTIRHSVADGLPLMGTLKNVFDQNNKTGHTLTPKITNSRPKIDLRNARIHTNIFSTKRERPFLKIGNKSNWNLVTYVEQNPTYLSLIKKLRRRLNVGFIDVIGAAICASVQDYITQKRRLEMDSFTMTNVVRVDEREEKEIINKTYNFKELSNTMSFETYTISFGTNERTMKQKILSMQHISKSLRNSADFLVPDAFLRDICSHTPIEMAKFLRNMFVKRITICITNLVGFDKCSYCNFSIDDIHFSVPNFLTVGFLFCIFSYDGRIGISVLSARGYVYNREELQTIIEDTFKYIDEAGEEILDCKTDA